MSYISDQTLSKPDPCGGNELSYVSTPIFYPNAEPHIGHANTIVIADIIARLGRMFGVRVWMSTGMDEHGQKVERAALSMGRQPQEHVDIIAREFASVCSRLCVVPDVFLRTTSPNHIQTAIKFWNQIKGHLYEGEYEGWYSPKDEAFVTEQGPDTIWTKESCMFFRLSDFQDRLLNLYETGRVKIYPESALHEMQNIIKAGLRDLCVTRKSKWGITPPDMPDHTMYVWIDALSNYLSASPTGSYYPGATHIIGKDILRFHAIYWPALLMAAGYEPGFTILSHGWWMQGGAKMSKSEGNVVSPGEFIDRYSADAVRYYFARAKRLESDASLDWSEIERISTQELLGGFGNLGQRLLCLANKHGHEEVKCELETVRDLPAKCEAAYHQNDPYLYAEALFNSVSALNKYLSANEPWKAPDPRPIIGCALDGWRSVVMHAEALIPNACAIWSEQLKDTSKKPTHAISFAHSVAHRSPAE